MMPTQDNAALQMGAAQQAPVASQMPSMSPEMLKKMGDMLKSSDAPETGSGLTPQYASAVMGSPVADPITQQFKQGIMGGGNQSLYNLNGVWNG